MKKYFENLAKALLGTAYKNLSEHEQKVIESIANEATVVEDVNKSFKEQLTFGQRMADGIAKFGGSWPFILIFVAIMIIWMTVNVLWLKGEEAFDPYPFILLNLALSTLAALQAPIIMMSQNRQAEKDRLEMAANYEVSLKTELEIRMLHQKIDEISRKLTEKEDNQ